MSSLKPKAIVTTADRTCRQATRFPLQTVLGIELAVGSDVTTSGELSETILDLRFLCDARTVGRGCGTATRCIIARMFCIVKGSDHGVYKKCQRRAMNGT